MMKILPNGFYTALGTPLDEEGRVIGSSLALHIERQLSAGAAGLFLLGTMGRQASVRPEECPRIAQVATDTVRRRIPLFYGVMDNSICRVLDRIELVKDLPLDGVVVTTPFYHISNGSTIQTFFREVADRSCFPVYLYDLPSVTKIKLTFEQVETLAAHPNIRGIKTADTAMIRQTQYSDSIRDDFNILYSGIDLFDMVSTFGVCRHLDGMFCCTPSTTSRIYRHFAQNEIAQGGALLSQIISLRDTMRSFGVFAAMTAAMNMLGYEGNFAPDYMGTIDGRQKEILRERLIEMGEM